MDGHQHEGVSDEALERDVEVALSVDPSPEFLPRVRARIAGERMDEGGFWTTPWRWATAVAAASAVVIVGVWTLREPVPVPQEARITPPVEAAAPIAPAPPAPVTAPVVRAVRTMPRPKVVEPFEVVISPEESAALQNLFAAIGNRQIETRALPDLSAALKPPTAIEEIVLEPITISPLAALEGE